MQVFLMERTCNHQERESFNELGTWCRAQLLEGAEGCQGVAAVLVDEADVL